MTSIPDTVAAAFPDPPEGVALAEIDFARIPRHVAVIMDGNGRWAKRRGLPRIAGHKAGVAAVREAIVAANDLGIEVLTIYSFSSENWTRPVDEVTGLMSLFAEVLEREIEGLHRENVRLKVLGRLEELPRRTRETFERGIERTAANSGMTLAIAVNYGSRNEIVDAVRSIARDVEAGVIDPASVDETLIGSRLYTAGLPDPDLLIRTSGELRLSNFLLWQIAYSELWVTEKFWPEFDRYDLLSAVAEYQRRDRRFGGAK